MNWGQYSVVSSSVQKVKELVEQLKISLNIVIEEGRAATNDGIHRAENCQELIEDIQNKLILIGNQGHEVDIAVKEQTTGVDQITAAIHTFSNLSK